MANGVYTKGLYLIGSGGVNLASGDLRVLLVKSTYTFDKDHNFINPAISTGSLEISGGGYARQVITPGQTFVEDDTSDMAYLDADDVTFLTIPAGQTAGGAVLYLYNALDTAAPLLAFYEFSPTIPTNGGDIKVQWAVIASGGILKLA